MAAPNAGPSGTYASPKRACPVKNGRHFLYVSHLWHGGWSILDVSHPASAEHNEKNSGSASGSRT